MMELLLDVNNLSITFKSKEKTVHAVRNVSFHVNRGEVLAIVGESGCGKSVTAKSIMRLLPEKTGRIMNGSIMFDGKEITTMMTTWT